MYVVIFLLIRIGWTRKRRQFVVGVTFIVICVLLGVLSYSNNYYSHLTRVLQSNNIATRRSQDIRQGGNGIDHLNHSIAEETKQYMSMYPQKLDKLPDDGQMAMYPQKLDKLPDVGQMSMYPQKLDKLPDVGQMSMYPQKLDKLPDVGQMSMYPQTLKELSNVGSNISSLVLEKNPIMNSTDIHNMSILIDKYFATVSIISRLE